MKSEVCGGKGGLITADKSGSQGTEVAVVLRDAEHGTFNVVPGRSPVILLNDL